MAKTRTVSFSELDVIRQCRLRHRLGYIERWVPAEEAETLKRGRMFHQLMEDHYSIIKMVQREGVSWMETEEYAERKYRMRALVADPDSAAQTPMQELVEWMYTGYAAEYGIDEEWTIVAVEHPFEVWLPTATGHRSSFRFKGKIDLVVRWAGALWIVDHKTCRNLPKGKELDLDDQFALYEWGLRQRGNEIRGIIHNAVRTERLKTREMGADERFKRTPTVRTQVELDTIAREAYEQFFEAYHGIEQGPNGLDPTGSREGRGDPPRSPNTDMCRWRCQYTDVCLAGRKGANMRQLLAELGYKQDYERH